MQTIKLKCCKCSVLFERRLASYKVDVRRGRKSFYCSLGCAKRQPCSDISCTNCGELFKAKDYRINRKRRFCSSSCSASYSNKHKNKGTRRSKLEVWLSEELQRTYPNIPMCFNDLTAIGYELDIYIPSIRLAIEFNGIFHYEPVYGQAKLERIQMNDVNKFQECQAKGISLCVIDTSSQKVFKVKTSAKFLDICKSVISQALNACSGDANAKATEMSPSG